MSSRRRRKSARSDTVENPDQGSGSSFWKKGDSLTLAIDDLADTGEGIGHADGFAFFVKDAVPGDTVLATVMRVKSRYGYAHLDEILTPSPDRVNPPCPVARACGGCQLQVWDYAAELSWKERRVRGALSRIGRFPEKQLAEVMLPIAGAEISGKDEGAGVPAGIYRYRNKAQFPVAVGKDGRPAVGFYAARTHSVIPVSDCLLGDQVFGEIIRIILAYAERQQVTPYDEKTGEGVLRHILIRRGHHSGQIGVTLVVNRQDKEPTGTDGERIVPGLTGLADELFTRIPDMTSLSLNLNSERTNVILGRRLIPVRGDLCIEDTMCGLRFRISPLSFYQVNTAQAERLYRQAMEFAALTGSETVIDLYCGIGTITLLAAKHAARVIGVEIVPEAVRDAEANAVLNGIDNAQFRAGKAEEILPALKDEGICPDVLIVDPPRAGLDPFCIDAIRHLAPSRIVYISCNPATLARDLKLLISLPIQDEDDAQESLSDARESLAPCYRLTAARAYDLFPRSIHVEVVSLLQRMSNTLKKTITLDVDMEDYHRIKSEGR